MQTTVNILTRLVEDDQNWAKLAGIPGLTDGWHGLAGSLEGALLEFQVTPHHILGATMLLTPSLQVTENDTC